MNVTVKHGVLEFVYIFRIISLIAGYLEPMLERTVLIEIQNEGQHYKTKVRGLNHNKCVFKHRIPFLDPGHRSSG